MMSLKRPSHESHCAPSGAHICLVSTRMTPVPPGQHVSVLVDVPQVTHAPPEQSPLAQSVGATQETPVAHFEQVAPPQSIPVSSASLIPSEQCDVVQDPLPSQTTPPFSVHGVPSGAFVVPQALPTHAATTHAVPVAGQSLLVAQPPHADPVQESVPVPASVPVPVAGQPTCPTGQAAAPASVPSPPSPEWPPSDPPPSTVADPEQPCPRNVAPSKHPMPSQDPIEVVEGIRRPSARSPRQASMIW